MIQDERERINARYRRLQDELDQLNIERMAVDAYDAAKNETPKTLPELILAIVSDGPKSSKEIVAEIKRRGHCISRPAVYNRLSVMKRDGRLVKDALKRYGIPD